MNSSRFMLKVCLVLGSLFSVGCSKHWIQDYQPEKTVLQVDEYAIPTWRVNQLFLTHAYFDGLGPFVVILDTGIYGVRLDDGLATRLRQQNEALVKDRNKGSNRFGSLLIGDLELKGLMFESQNLSDISQALGTDIHGIVGLHPFHQLMLTFDFPGEEVRVSRGRLNREMEGVMPIQFDDVFRPVIDYQIGHQKGKLLVDTGAASGVLLGSVEGIDWIKAPERIGVTHTLSGSSILMKGQVDGVARVGLIELTDPIIGVRSGTSVLGVEALREYILIFDQPSGLMRFQAIGQEE